MSSFPPVTIEAYVLEHSLNLTDVAASIVVPVPSRKDPLVRKRHTFGGAALSLATVTVSALALTGLTATSAQALPKSGWTLLGPIPDLEREDEQGR
jgi:hypothetical protein